MLDNVRLANSMKGIYLGNQFNLNIHIRRILSARGLSLSFYASGQVDKQFCYQFYVSSRIPQFKLALEAKCANHVEFRFFPSILVCALSFHSLINISMSEDDRLL